MGEKEQEFTKEGKLEKAKELLEKLKELELGEEELEKIAGGEILNSGAWTGT